MGASKKNKYKVIFECNPDVVDDTIANALLTQLMVTTIQEGLKIDRISCRNDIIEKE